MNTPLLKKLGYVLLLVVAETVGLYFVIRPEKTVCADQLPTNGQIAAKNANVVECRVNQRGIPVMGYGFLVICIKRDAVLWIR